MDPIQRLEARQAAIQAELRAIPALAQTENRDVTDAEFDTLAELRGEYTKNEERLTSLREAATVADEQRAAQTVADPFANGGAPKLGDHARTDLRSEPYAKMSGESFFLDLAAARSGDIEARERLDLNTKYVDSKAREAGRKVEVRGSTRMTRQNQPESWEKRSGETTTLGAGGEWAPPLWAESEWIGYLRAGRIFADRVKKLPLPKGVSSINIPKLTGGTQAAVQGTQNTGVNVQDVTTSSVSAGITTLAGGAVISQQLLDQSPLEIDEIILQDLAQDLAKRIDLAVIAAVAGVSGLNSITYTSASPTTTGVIGSIQQAIDAVSSNLYNWAPDTLVMHPVRWGKILSALDGQQRPLVLPSAAYGPYNSLGTANGQTPQGYAGNLRGVDVFLDANIPQNLGGGTNQDEIFVLRADQLRLYESVPRFESFEQTYAQNASIFVRALEYYSIIPNRYAPAISLLTGTGMATTLAYGS